MALLDEPITNPTAGLYLGQPPNLVPQQGLVDCLNVRIKQRSIEHGNFGWAEFPKGADPTTNLDGKPVMLIDRFRTRDGDINTIFANTTDVFEFDDVNDKALYLTQREETGTVDVTNGSTTVSGTGTSWTSTLKAGDFIHVGTAGQRELTATWYEIASITNDTELELTETYNESTAAGQDYTARSTFTGDSADIWDSEEFFNAVDLTQGSDGDRWYATNGIDPVIAWNGDTDQVYEPNLGNVDTAQYLVRFSNLMIYVAPTVSGDKKSFSIRTSDIGKPEDTVNGTAAELIVHPDNDPLVAAAPIGDLLALYGDRSITLAQFVGSPTIFNFRGAAVDRGPVAKRAVAVFPDRHYYIGIDGQYVFDGSQAAPINEHVWREVRRRTPADREYQAIAAFHEEQGELFWVTPQTSDDNNTAGLAFVQHYLEDTGRNMPAAFSKRELPITAIGDYQRQESISWDDLTEEWEQYNFRWNDRFFTAQFPQKLIGMNNGDIFILGESSKQNGSDVTSFARFSRVALGSVERTTVVRRVYPFIEELDTGNLAVRVFGAEAPHGQTTLRSNQDLDMALPDELRFVSPLQPMRYAEIEFRRTDSGFWRLSGYTLDAVPGGRR